MARADGVAMDNIRNNMAARAADLRLYLDFNPDHQRFNAVSLGVVWVEKRS